MSPILVGLDLGTTLCKCIATDDIGTILADSSFRIHTNHTISNGAEQDPLEWKNAIVWVMKDVANQLRERSKDIISIAVCTHGPGVVFSDKLGKPLMPCAIWQDNRSAQYGYELIENIGCDWIGQGLPQTGLAARLNWIHRTRPSVINEAYHIHGIKGYVLFILTGRYVTEPSSSGFGKSWDMELLNFCGVSLSQMDEIIPSNACVGSLLKEVAQATGFPANTSVIAGLNDGAAATLGAGITNSESGIVSVSTNGIARLVVEKKVPGRLLFEHSLFCWPYIEDKYIIGGFTKTAGDAVQWLIDIAYRDIPKNKQLTLYNREADRSSPGSKGVVFLPWLMGRGSPNASDTPSAAFNNLARHHTRGDFARAIFEGVGFAIKDIYLKFIELGYNWGDVRLTGGGMKSTLWRSIICNILNINARRTTSDSLVGMTMLAGLGVGILPSLMEACDYFVKFANEPNTWDPELSSLYYREYQNYLDYKYLFNDI